MFSEQRKTVANMLDMLPLDILTYILMDVKHIGLTR